MRTFNAIIVLADISGYTEFLVMNRSSLLHAEQIITELMESVTTNAAFPLALHKLEGDAAFMYAETCDTPEKAVNDVMRQVAHFMERYKEKQTELFNKSLGGCVCSACRAIENLTLKCVVHCGEVLQKQVSGRVELAGAPVILAHRLMKNSVESDTYVLVTHEVADALERPPYDNSKSFSEKIEHFGVISTIAYFPDATHLDRGGIKPLTRARGYGEAARLFALGLAGRVGSRKNRVFSNLPKS